MPYELEEQFLEGLSREPLPAEELTHLLRGVHASGQMELADSWAELLQEAMVGRAGPDQALDLLEIRASWHPADSSLRIVCRKTAGQLVGRGHDAEKFVKAAGFDDGVLLGECLRRLRTLLHLKPGTLCREKTWGFGVIRNVNAFYQEVEVDFEGRKGHRLSLAYAAEKLQLLEDHHILAVRHRDSDRLTALVRSDPAEVVRMALRSYGAMSAGQLREILSGSVVPPEEWKTFWEAARKALRTDPLVDVPTGRADPIRLLSKERAYDADWFSRLSRERDMDRILSQIAEMESAAPDAASDPAAREILTERLAYVVRGATERQTGIRVRAVMAALRLGLGGQALDVACLMESLFEPDCFFRAMNDLSAQEGGELLARLTTGDRERTRRLLLENLERMKLPVLNLAMDLLLRDGGAAQCADGFREMVAGRRPTVEILYWLARRLDLAAAWNTGRPADMPFLILDALSLNYSGESLKAANQLRALFQQQEWLQPVVSAMSREQREDLMRRLNQPLGGVGVDSRAVMARMIRMYPELNATLASEETRASDDGPSPRGGYTSWRSHRARQAQYQKLVNEDIPGNSREIALARSYGDLSENYEYKAAKEHQRLLLQRQAELEQDLQSIRGTDFSEFPTDIAGMGTSVTLRHEDGHTQDLFILGEWDQDEPLGIISCRSRLGLILAGRRAGDGVTIPTGHGEAPCTVVKVAGLPDSIRKWVRGE